MYDPAYLVLCTLKPARHLVAGALDQIRLQTGLSLRLIVKGTSVGLRVPVARAIPTVTLAGEVSQR